MWVGEVFCFCLFLLHPMAAPKNVSFNGQGYNFTTITIKNGIDRSGPSIIDEIKPAQVLSVQRASDCYSQRSQVHGQRTPR